MISIDCLCFSEEVVLGIFHDFLPSHSPQSPDVGIFHDVYAYDGFNLLPRFFMIFMTIGSTFSFFLRRCRYFSWCLWLWWVLPSHSSLPRLLPTVETATVGTLRNMESGEATNLWHCTAQILCTAQRKFWALCGTNPEQKGRTLEICLEDGILFRCWFCK